MTQRIENRGNISEKGILLSSSLMLFACIVAWNWNAITIESSGVSTTAERNSAVVAQGDASALEAPVFYEVEPTVQLELAVGMVVEVKNIKAVLDVNEPATVVVTIEQLYEDEDGNVTTFMGVAAEQGYNNVYTPDEVVKVSK